MWFNQENSRPHVLIFFINPVSFTLTFYPGAVYTLKNYLRTASNDGKKNI